MGIYEAQLEESLRKVEGGADVLAARRQPSRQVKPTAPTKAARKMQDEGRLMRLEQEGKITRGSGSLPENFWDLPMPEDPDASIRRAVGEDRR